MGVLWHTCEAWKALSESETTGPQHHSVRDGAFLRLLQLVEISAVDDDVVAISRYRESTVEDLAELTAIVAANISKLTTRQQRGLRQAMEKVVSSTWATVLPLIADETISSGKQAASEQTAPQKAAVPVWQPLWLSGSEG